MVFKLQRKNLITFKRYGPKAETLEKINQASKYYKDMVSNQDEL